MARRAGATFVLVILAIFAVPGTAIAADHVPHADNIAISSAVDSNTSADDPDDSHTGLAHTDRAHTDEKAPAALIWSTAGAMMLALSVTVLVAGSRRRRTTR